MLDGRLREKGLSINFVENPLMNASSGTDSNSGNGALFARASRNSERVILPISDGAVRMDTALPAFYCVHSASGVAGTDFIALAKRLESAVRFYGIQAPPKLMGDAKFGGSVEAIAQHYADALVKFQPTGPFVLGGYCVGAIIAMAMAENLRDRGREVGLLVAIDGVPENTGIALRRWNPHYWLELFRNLPGWIKHGDLMRSRTLRSLIWSLSNNAYAIGKSLVGLKRGEKMGGGYAIDGIMDLTNYPPTHRLFINRLFAAMFAYIPGEYSGDVVVYEAKVTPLLYLPLIGRTWRQFAPHSQIIGITATHIGMMREPYVDALAKDLLARCAGYFSRKST
jgi:thioesterase domain-containing protein